MAYLSGGKFDGKTYPSPKEPQAIRIPYLENDKEYTAICMRLNTETKKVSGKIMPVYLYNETVQD